MAWIKIADKQPPKNEWITVWIPLKRIGRKEMKWDGKNWWHVSTYQVQVWEYREPVAWWKQEDIPDYKE